MGNFFPNWQPCAAVKDVSGHFTLLSFQNGPILIIAFLYSWVLFHMICSLTVCSYDQYTFFFKLTLNLCFNLSHLCLENFLWSPVCEIMCTNCYWYLKFKVNIHVYNVANYQFELFCNWTFLISCCQRAGCVRVWILLWILQMCDHIKVHVHIKFQTSNRYFDGHDYFLQQKTIEIFRIRGWHQLSTEVEWR